MNVLLLGSPAGPLTPVLENHGCTVLEWSDPVDVGLLDARSIDFAVSYRYRHIVRQPVIERLAGRIINLHISLLPWNRGADPNLWSFLEDTPKGFTLHWLDKGVDTGDIIAQEEVRFDKPGETLATTYASLNAGLVRLFETQWPIVVRGASNRIAQPPGGTLHRLKDKEPFMHLLADKGWDTPVEELVGKASPARRPPTP